MVTLPPAQTSTLRGFWVIVGSGCAMILTLPLTVMSGSKPLLVFGLAAIGVVVPGLVRPHVLEFVYRTWDRLVCRFVLIATIFITGVCFAIVAMAGLRTRPRRRFAPRSSSMWEQRTQSRGLEYFRCSSESRQKVSRLGWISNFLMWATGPNRWARCLIPFIWLLMILEPNEDHHHPTEIYTLY